MKMVDVVLTLAVVDVSTRIGLFTAMKIIIGVEIQQLTVMLSPRIHMTAFVSALLSYQFELYAAILIILFL